jgi:hypothetical protein
LRRWFKWRLGPVNINAPAEMQEFGHLLGAELAVGPL